MTEQIEQFNLAKSQREALHKTLIWTKDFFNNVPAEAHIGGHGFDKTMRQSAIAARLSQREGQPIFLPTLTAMIMDVGRTKSSDLRSRSYQHGILSREMVSPLLDLIDILSKDDRVLVEEAVEDHPKMNENVRRNYVVEIAMDADRLDCLGPLGPLRAATWRPNIPLILPGETDSRSGDTDILTIWQDMSIRQMEWVDMLWTKAAKEECKDDVEEYKKYLNWLQIWASRVYSSFDRLEIS